MKYLETASSLWPLVDEINGVAGGGGSGATGGGGEDAGSGDVVGGGRLEGDGGDRLRDTSGNSTSEDLNPMLFGCVLVSFGIE
ncbi:hypothetical protein Acr_09g0001710 [Actinidia rufa]|uniref:Uncharacterized protein n=1 Tax=Actinidia rufa TaxID=165716 RepID=A0A7J0F4V7_9ERIC|nr:hypothetical protein Acr_09g0001710 [Actinidia rufa]